jgi:hypothetical protein
MRPGGSKAVHRLSQDASSESGSCRGRSDTGAKSFRAASAERHTTISPGQTTTLDVRISGAKDLLGQYNVLFNIAPLGAAPAGIVTFTAGQPHIFADPNYVFTGVSGGFLSNGQPSHFHTFQSSDFVTYPPGNVAVGPAVLLARLQITADSLAPVDAQYEISLDARSTFEKVIFDSSGNQIGTVPIDFSITPTIVTIVAPAATAKPSSRILASLASLTGLFGHLRWRRRSD